MRRVLRGVGWVAVGLFLLVGAFFEFGGGFADVPATWNSERAADMADKIQDEFDVTSSEARCIVGFVRERYEYDEWAGMTKDEAVAAGEREGGAMRNRCLTSVIGVDHGPADLAYCTLLDAFYDAPVSDSDAELDALYEAGEGDLGPTLRGLVDQSDAASDEVAFNRVADEIDEFCSSAGPR